MEMRSIESSSMVCAAPPEAAPALWPIVRMDAMRNMHSAETLGEGGKGGKGK